MTTTATRLDDFSEFISLIDADARIYIQTDDEWDTLFVAWARLARFLVCLSDEELVTACSSTPDSATHFAVSIVQEKAAGGFENRGSEGSQLELLKEVFHLVCRLLLLVEPPDRILQWEVLADFSKVYGQTKTNHISSLLSNISQPACDVLVRSLTMVRRDLFSWLNVGSPTNSIEFEAKLTRLNNLLTVSPLACEKIMSDNNTVSDIMAAYRPTDPPLREALIATAYLCIMGLAKSPTHVLLLSKQLDAFSDAARKHRAGPRGDDENLVAELVTRPLLVRKLRDALRERDEQGEQDEPGSRHLQARLDALEEFRKPGGSMGEMRHRAKAKANAKGRSGGKRTRAFTKLASSDPVTTSTAAPSADALIAQVKAFLPQLGAGFIAKLLFEYNNNVQEITEHVLDGTLPEQLKNADRSEELLTAILSERQLPLQPAGNLLPMRKSVTDGDELDNLTVPLSRLNFGKANKTTNEILRERPPLDVRESVKAAVAEYDMYEDERDDTYDAVDVGGTVDTAAGEEPDAAADRLRDEHLFRIWKENRDAFNSDAATRRGARRAKLLADTGMTNEQVEGWALVLGRDAKKQRLLGERYDLEPNSNSERGVAGTAWRAGQEQSENGDDDDDDDDNDDDGKPDGGRLENDGVGGPSRGRGGGPRRGRGGRASHAAGSSGQRDTAAARGRKEEHKAGRANHDRRNQRAKKMGRVGGFTS